MRQARAWKGQRAIGRVLLVLVALGTMVAAGCGSDGGSSDDGLCAQCGDTDGPCRTSVAVSGSEAQTLCDGQTSCDVQLACLRKLGSAQRRCFPADQRFDQFRCDGERANRSTTTPTPAPAPTATSATPTATGVTPTVAISTSPSPTATPACGNGVLDDGEECDGLDLDDETCENLCEDGAGTLGCTSSCTFDFSGCDDPSICSSF